MDIIKEIHNEQDQITKKSVVEMFKSGDDISISLIQRKCKVGYFSASRVLDSLICGRLVKTNGNIYRYV
jgi:DNA segregation ATPase FtsK/SpoIIIE-like protein